MSIVKNGLRLVRLVFVSNAAPIDNVDSSLPQISTKSPKQKSSETQPMRPINPVVKGAREFIEPTTQTRPRSHEQSSRTKPNSKQQTYTPEKQTVTFKRGNSDNSTSTHQTRPRSAPVKLEPLKKSRPKPDSKQQTYTPEQQTGTFKRGNWDKVETQIHEENDKVYTSSKSASATETKDVVQYVNEICKLHDDIHDLKDQIETLKNRKKARVDIVHPDDLQGDELRFPE